MDKKKQIKNNNIMKIGKGFLLLCLPLFFLTACNIFHERKNINDLLLKEEIEEINYGIKMEFASQPWSKGADSLFIRFKVIDLATNSKVYWRDLKKVNIKLRETGGNPPEKDIILRDITGNTVQKTERISDDVVFWLMVDKSNTILQNDMDSMKFAIRETVETLPEGSVYLSFFDKEPSERILLSKDNFNEIEAEFKITKESKNLYQSIIHNFEIFVKEELKKGAPKYLFVFTDGKINENSVSEVTELLKFPNIAKDLDSNFENQVQIHAFRYGNFPFADQALMSICKQHRKEELKGEFQSTNDVAGSIASYNKIVDNLLADYEIILVNHSDKIYIGEQLTLQTIINNGNNKAFGEIRYAIGTKEIPEGPGVKSDHPYLAIIFGVIFLFIAFFIMQAVIPFIVYKTSNFEKKFVKPYEPSDEEVEELCPFDMEPFEPGQLIVTKCSHKIHWECWKENGHKCMEYGQNCKDGIQFYFNKNHTFDLKKSPHYFKWAMSGLLGGLFTWIIFYFTSGYGIFSELVDVLLKVFYPERLKEEVDNIMQISSVAKTTFHSKIGGLLLAGMLLGFILTFLFSTINEFRQKKFRVLFAIFFRAVIGMTVGFISFLIGSIISIILGAYSNVAWIDAIPWLLFGGSIGLCLAYKTTIKWQDAFIGGIISGIISFFILYTVYYLPAIGVILSFMLCCAGLGISIATKHHAAQKYFLKYKGERKQGEIAIHKWMNESGGSNEVTIGKSNHCIIQMNWDDSNKIHNMQAKLFLDPKRKQPTLRVLENGMTFDGRNASRDNLFQLKNGVKFKIGNTEFQYIEK